MDAQNNKIAIYSPVRNETRLKEWIKYYDNLKIDLFILLDDFSEVPVENYFKELDNINYEIIRHNEQNWNNETLQNNTKGSYARTQAITDYVLPICKKHNIDYILHVDADEFLYLNKFNSMEEVINWYNPFDELRINWLLFNHSNIKYNDSESVIKTYTQSQNYINLFSKSLTKVSSIISGCNAHCFLLKQPHVSKNIFNTEVNFAKNCHTSFNFKNHELIHYNACPLFIAHYVYKSVNDFIEKKCCSIDGNFVSIFGTDDYETKKKIINFNKINKNDIVEYVYLLLQNNNDLKNNEKIKKIEIKIPFIKELKNNFLRYYKMFDSPAVLQRCKLPNDFFSYHENLLLKNKN